MTRPCDYDDGYDDDVCERAAAPMEGDGVYKFSSIPIANLLENLETRKYLTKICESPIEISLGAAILECGAKHFDIFPQYPLRRFRYDFAVFRIGENKPRMLIECDGREFHQTKEQLGNDRIKDSVAAEHGIKIMRFPGKQIHVDPIAVAKIVLAECSKP